MFCGVEIRDGRRTARSAVFALESYDRVGVVLRPITEEPFSLFVPWSAVIELSRAGSEEPWIRS